jgi:sugar lactone lactonase YvrE
MVVGLLTVLSLPFPSGSARAALEHDTIATRLVKMISIDDSGLPIRHPSKVMYDPVYQETYLVSSTRRITIYDKNFFPQGSIGVGRGVIGVNGMGLDPRGLLYLSQGEGDQARITVYDQALFVDRQIALSKIDGLAGFRPGSLDVAADGTIYVVGYFPMRQADRHQGALVLDRAGNFKKWLTPRNEVLRKRPQPAAGGGPAPPAASEAGEGADLPASLKPAPARARADEPDVFQLVSAPVGLDFVTIDGDGRIYLLSTETSETYVYDRQERFLFSFGQKGGANGKLSTPRTLGIDYARRLIYVVDFMRHTILAYDYETGKFIYEFGGKGVSPLWYQHPESLAVDNDGLVIVADLFNDRVQVVDPANPERPILEPLLPPGVDVPAPAAPPPAAPEWSGPLTGLATPVRVAAVAPPTRVPVAPVREIGAGFVKKKMLAPPPSLRIADIAPLSVPAGLAEPPSFAVVPVAAAAVGQGKSGGPARVPRAVVGVYGPVAVLLDLGIWLLRR